MIISILVSLSYSLANEGNNGQTPPVPVLDCLLPVDFKDLPS